MTSQTFYKTYPIKALLLFVLLANSINVIACREAVNMHDLIFGSDLIVHTKIISHTDNYYSIKVLDIYRDNKIGIKIGDYIRIKRQFNVESSAEIVHRQNIIDKLTGIAYLVKSEQGWHVRAFPFFYNENISLKFDHSDCEVRGKAAKIKKDFQEYFNEFHIDKEGNLIGRSNAEEITNSKVSDLVLIQYTLKNLFSVSLQEKIQKQLFCFSYEEEIETIDLTQDSTIERKAINVFVDPISIEQFSIIQEQIKAAVYKQYPHLRKDENNRIIFFKLHFEIDGTISKVEIMRSFSDEASSVILDFFC